ncbi:GpE family phage tail protein [Comamonas piscis]|uniref:GpE family phage tail protein n=1 Tax=Comamonas piscis TaxID=1562974 RepID=A0A7G5ELY9_9BURK|nr:GpE family phage tail protein [Comamonas piscis]QMV75014.1 GpE family phage tail protein [Comamonas piscis]WSO33494.1 GpE family phage tail protein [Comamonas piscis]
MADIATIWHWPLQSMCDMELGELMQWRAMAVDRYNLMHKKPDK